MRFAIFVSVILGMAVSSPSARGEEPPPFLLLWGSRGSDDGEFTYPKRAAVSPDKSVYVVDNRIQKFSPPGAFVDSWGAGIPYAGVAVNDQGTVYAAESTWPHRIFKYSPDGALLASWTTVSSGKLTGIAASPDGHVYASVISNRFVSVYKFDGDGRLVARWGGQTDPERDLSSPTDIAVDRRGVVFVLSSFRVHAFDSNGAVLGMWALSAEDGSRVRFPGAIAADFYGNLYVTEWDICTVYKYTSEGLFLTQWGSCGAEPGQFWEPRGIAAGPDQSVYVVDTRNHRVQKFGFAPVPAHLSTWGRIKAERR